MLATLLPLLVLASVVGSTIHHHHDNAQPLSMSMEGHSEGRVPLLRRHQQQYDDNVRHLKLHHHHKKSFGHAHATFGIRLYDAIISTSAVGDNVVFSPLSVAALLYALAEGANGTTADEIYHVLNRTLETSANDHHKLATTKMRTMSPSLTVLLASRLYVQKGREHVVLLPDFVQRLDVRYGTKSEELDFEQDSSAAERVVNDWVAETTRQHITTLIPPGALDAQTKIVLVNCLYLKADWRTQFDQTKTRPRTFHLEGSGGGTKLASSTIKVPTMYVQDEFPYRDFHRLKFEMLELPYATGSVSMFVVLPYAESSLARTARLLMRRPALLANPRGRLFNTTVTVLLPKFDLKATNVDLKQSLVRLGVRQAFELGKADLSKMDGTMELYVSDVYHKAVLEVDENGSRAAASSGLVIKGRSMNSDPVFRAERPFIFFIRHNPTSTILFLGHVKHLENSTTTTASVDV